MMEAQRYPQDFDGIVAGAPAYDWPGLAATMISIAQTLYPNPAQLETNVLTREALQKLHAAVIEQCDAQDGLKDGVIQNPAAVHFDLSKVSGLTDEQRKAIEIIFRGARTGKGQIYPGFAPVAECVPDQWIAWITGPVPAFAKDHAPDLTFAFGTQIFKYLIFNLVKHPMVVATEREDAGIFKVGQVPRGFCLREFEDFFQIGNAHFLIFKDQMKYSQPRFICARFENLGTQR
jgi:feruloyl esterase